jgi:hypothetical protein
MRAGLGPLKRSLTPPFFTEVPVSSQVTEWLCICVSDIYFSFVFLQYYATYGSGKIHLFEDFSISELSCIFERVVCSLRFIDC